MDALRGNEWIKRERRMTEGNEHEIGSAQRQAFGKEKNAWGIN
jgi:hypothetical protein